MTRYCPYYLLYVCHLVIIWKPPLYTPCSVYYNEEKRFNAWISTVATHSIVT